jgi:hypothetical protein
MFVEITFSILYIFSLTSIFPLDKSETDTPRKTFRFSFTAADPEL